MWGDMGDSLKKKMAFPYFFLGLPNFQTQQFNGREGLSASIINSAKINAFLELGFSFFHIWSSPEACIAIESEITTNLCDSC